MSLEIISNAAYHDAVKTVKKAEYKPVEIQDQAVANIKISEVQANVTVGGSSQTKNEQEKGDREAANKEQQIKDAVSKANNQLGFRKTYCEFSYDEVTKRVSIKVLDEDTKEVIREIQPEETLEMVKKMWELAGILIDERR